MQVDSHNKFKKFPIASDANGIDVLKARLKRREFPAFSIPPTLMSQLTYVPDPKMWKELIKPPDPLWDIELVGELLKKLYPNQT